MSIEAVTWALQQTLPDAGTKLVLVAIANLADKQHRCFPGRAHLADASCQTEQKVAEDVRALRAAKLLADTGMRGGRTGRAVIWELGVAGPVEDRAPAAEWETPF